MADENLMRDWRSAGAAQLAGLGRDDLVLPSHAGTSLRVRNFRRSLFDRATLPPA